MAISEPHGKCKPKSYNRYTHTQIKTTQMQHKMCSSNHKKVEGRKKTYSNQLKIIKKMAIQTYILITTIKVNGLIVSTKRHRLTE